MGILSYLSRVATFFILFVACAFAAPKVVPPSQNISSVEEIFNLRVFSEPLVPIGGEPSAEENRALVDALNQYDSRSNQDDFSSLRSFVSSHPASKWAASLLTDMGIEY